MLLEPVVDDEPIDDASSTLDDNECLIDRIDFRRRGLNDGVSLNETDWTFFIHFIHSFVSIRFYSIETDRRRRFEIDESATPIPNCRQ